MKGENAMRKKRVIVACNNGVATSQTIVSKLEDMLEARGVKNVELQAVDIKAIDTYLATADVYVATIVPDHDFNVPVINGIAFLTGIGADTELQKIIDIANN